MELPEARQVLWLKSNLRPMGKLFDEGYLSQTRLEWAAKWAYNPRQKEAAQVLLSSLNAIQEQPSAPTSSPELQIGMTLDQARQTAWPFGVLKGQLMGDLLNSKQLSLKDLGYAIETAWDLRVKQAAIALTLARLEQAIKEPPPSAGPVHIVSAGKSYAQKQETRLTLIQGLIFGFRGWTGWVYYDFRESIGGRTEYQCKSDEPNWIRIVYIGDFVGNRVWWFAFLAS